MNQTTFQSGADLWGVGTDLLMDRLAAAVSIRCGFMGRGDGGDRCSET